MLVTIEVLYVFRITKVIRLAYVWRHCGSVMKQGPRQLRHNVLLKQSSISQSKSYCYVCRCCVRSRWRWRSEGLVDTLTWTVTSCPTHSVTSKTTLRDTWEIGSSSATTWSSWSTSRMCTSTSQTTPREEWRVTLELLLLAASFYVPSSTTVVLVHCRTVTRTRLL